MNPLVPEQPRKLGLPWFLGILFASLITAILVHVGASVYSSRHSPAGKTPQELAIESKGLPEFSADHNRSDTVSAQDKQLAAELSPILKEMPDGKDIRKDIKKSQSTIVALDKIIGNYPEYSDAYLLRATAFLLANDTDYQRQLSDIDNAIKYHSSDKYKTAFDSTAAMYGSRAKVNMLANNYQQAIRDLETAIKNDPSNTNAIFNTGGVKPDDASNPTALLRNDLDLLVAKYPEDYRTYMFRGLFYLSFTTFDEQYYAPTLSDLEQAQRLNPSAALLQYLLGSVYQKQASWTKAAWADVSEAGGYRDKTISVALQHFKDAITLNAGFAEAYAQVAGALYHLKRDSEAIPYYDKTVELLPNNAGAFNDRGLAKTNTNDYYGAISDFSKAIDLKKSKRDGNLDTTYEHRAAAYVKVMNHDRAIEDYGRAIGEKWASMVFLMSLTQMRGMYPEFNDISDRDLLEGLRRKYFPNMSSEAFADNYQKNEKPYEDFILAGFYGSRGDAYLSKGNFKKATVEYARALQAWSKYADRWKVISTMPGTEFSVDTQTLDFGQGTIVSLWVKAVNTDTKDYSQTNYQIDCSGRKVKAGLGTHYDSAGNVTSTSPTHDWESIAPESMAEVLCNGMCGRK